MTRDSPRSRILARIREASSDSAGTPHPGVLEPGPADAGDAEEPVVLFSTRFRARGGQVEQLESRERAREWLSRFSSEFRQAAISGEVPPELRPGLPESAPRSADLGVSVAAFAAADTGTLVLDSTGGRAVQLLPPAHLIWVPRRAVVPSLQEALSRAGLGFEPAAGVADLPSVLALHSGPSKSADMGGELVRGVHGPGRVVAAVLG